MPPAANPQHPTYNTGRVGAVKMADLTIERIEGAVHYRRWCAYHGEFHDKDAYSSAQKLAKWNVRYCTDLANAQHRATLTIKEPAIPLEQLVHSAKIMGVRITDLPAAAASLLSARDKRKAQRDVAAAGSKRPAHDSGATSSSTRPVGGAAAGNAEGHDDDDDDVPEVETDDNASEEDEDGGQLQAALPETDGPPDAGPSKPAARSKNKSKKAKKAKAKQKKAAVATKAKELPLMTQEAKDTMLSHWCPNTYGYDDANTDGTTLRDDGTGNLRDYQNFDTDWDWQLALDDVSDVSARPVSLHMLLTLRVCLCLCRASRLNSALPPRKRISICSTRTFCP